MKKSLAPFLCVFLLAMSAGCENGPDGAGPDTAPASVEIADREELEALWQEYLFDSDNLVGIRRSFSSAEEIEPLYIARFCWEKYLSEHDPESLEPEHEGSFLRLFPLDTALTYAKRYFDLDGLDVSEIDEGSYDPQRNAFLFSPGSDKGPPRPSYKGSLRGKRLKSAAKNADGTLTAVLERPDSQKFDRIEYTDTYTLKRRNDGSLYFLSGKREYVNNHLVSVTGDCRRFDKIEGFDEGFFDGSLDSLSMLGEADGAAIVVYAPYEEDKNAVLMRLNPETMAVEKKLEVSGNFTIMDVSMTDGRIVIRRGDRFTAVDADLSRSEDIRLPGLIAEKSSREPHYNEKGAPDGIFGGFDISSDGTKYVYSDEIGLKLYSAADGSEKLLSKTVPIRDSELIDNSFHWSPRFVDGGRKVITTMTGYEGSMGYTLCDLESGNVKTFGIGSEASSTGLIRYDTGLLEINTFIFDRSGQDGDYKTMYLDFHTGEVQDIALTDRGDTGYIVMSDQYYVGQDYAAFITSRSDRGDNDESEHYINRLNLKTMELEPKVVTVKAAATHILGVLSDGRVLFWYNLNPSENGVCISGNSKY